MNQSRRIALGLIGGIAVGLFFGERAAPLEWPARAFIQLLQVTVLPFVVTSLVSGIARGSSTQARRIAARGGVVLLVLWGLTLLLVALAPLALPPEKGGSFFATTALTAGEEIDWLNLYIPANPFWSLANNVVPAVVVFSVLLGVALLGVRDKDRILGPLRLANDMLGRAGNLLVGLTPFGIFAIAGHAAGTLRLEEFERLQGFLLLAIGLALILMLWILPGLTAALTGVSHRRILSLMWEPLITSFATANLFIVLPLLQERGKRLLTETQQMNEEAGEAVDVLVSTSFTFPHSAKLLSLSFVLFAGWFVGSPLTLGQLPVVAGAGLLSLFGSVNTAVPFLLDLVRLPADLFQLFVVSSVVIARFGSAAAAMHTFVLSFLGAYFMSAGLRVNKTRLLGFAARSVVIVGAFLAGSRAVLGAVLPGPEASRNVFEQLHVSGVWGMLAPVETVSRESPVESPPIPGRRLETVVSRGALRVCVSPDAMPWCYTNNQGEIIGFEVDIAHALAAELNTRLILVPNLRIARATALLTGACDLTVGRIIPSEGASIAFSTPVAHEAWAFLTHDHLRDVFASQDRIRQLRSPRIAVFRERAWIDRVKAQFPNAQVIPIDTITEFLDASDRFEATFTGFNRAAAYSLVHPELSVVVPAPDLGSVPIAIVAPKGEEPLIDFTNAFVEVGNANGAFKEKLDYWIRGKGAEVERAPRWSFARNVLGWWTD